jgi:hypothetical protein
MVKKLTLDDAVELLDSLYSVLANMDEQISQIDDPHLLDSIETSMDETESFLRQYYDDLES